MTAEEMKHRLSDRRQRIEGTDEEKHLALQNEQSFYNGVVSELARVKAGQDFVPHGACGEKVTQFVTECYQAMTDFYHGEREPKPSDEPKPTE